MKEQTDEQKDHFSSKRNHWCIVRYESNGFGPIYYQGYFGNHPNQGIELSPAFTTYFNDALKLHSKIEADKLLNNLKTHSPNEFNDCKVEDHRWSKVQQVLIIK